MLASGISRFIAAVAIAFAAGAVRADNAPRVGDVVDSFNGVPVYYNGAIAHTAGVHRAADGYVFGLRYQCVEFIKRYYYQRFRHRMPRPTGNARDYFDANVADGALNPARGLLQYRNGSRQGPQLEDILLLGPWPGNPYGHMAIVSAVNADSIEIIQQNPGPSGRSRRTFPLRVSESGIRVDQPRVVGWLHLPGRVPQSQPRAVPQADLPSPAESTPAPAQIPSVNAP